MPLICRYFGYGIYYSKTRKDSGISALFSYKDVRRLSELTSAFYKQYGESFSATRKCSWQGWDECIKRTRALRELLGISPKAESFGMLSSEHSAYSVLDVACGNMRFARYLEKKTQRPYRYLGVDFTSFEPVAQQTSVSAPIPEKTSAQKQTSIQPAASMSQTEKSFQHGTISFAAADLLSAWYKEKDEQKAVDIQMDFPSELKTLLLPADLLVCFGFFHHIPSQALRMRFIQLLATRLNPGAILIVSLWRFARSTKRRIKAEATTARAADKALVLEPGDYLLGWQEQSDYLRYCHSFSDKEIADLIAAVEACDHCHLLTRFESDGKEKNLNEYLVFSKDKDLSLL